MHRETTSGKPKDQTSQRQPACRAISRQPKRQSPTNIMQANTHSGEGLRAGKADRILRGKSLRSRAGQIVRPAEGRGSELPVGLRLPGLGEYGPYEEWPDVNPLQTLISASYKDPRPYLDPQRIRNERQNLPNMWQTSSQTANYPAPLYPVCRGLA